MAIKDFRKYYLSKNPGNSSFFDDYSRKAYQSPNILEEHEIRATQMDVFSRLFQERIIYFPSEVTAETCSIVAAQLLYLDQCGEKLIQMYIDSPGGACSSGMGLVETMLFVKSPIETINMGMCASMGSLLLAAGNKGMRKSLPSSKVLVHQPLIAGGGVSGPADDIIIEANEMAKLKDNLFGFLAARSKKTKEEIIEAAKRDCWLTAEESLEWGLIDEIIKIDWSAK